MRKIQRLKLLEGFCEPNVPKNSCRWPNGARTSGEIRMEIDTHQKKFKYFYGPHSRVFFVKNALFVDLLKERCFVYEF